MNILAFQWWLNKGLFTIGHFFTASGPISLGYCIGKLDVPNNEKFRLSQIMHFLHTIWADKPEPLKPNPYEQWCSDIMNQKGGFSIIYASLAERSTKPSYACAWESELEIHLDSEKWYLFFQRSYKGITNIALFKVKVKILTRWYYVPSWLARIYPDTSPMCYRGCFQVGSMYHICWTCLLDLASEVFGTNSST